MSEPQAKPTTAIAPAASQTLQESRVSVTLGIAPKSLDEGWRLAQLMAQSALVPKDFQGKPADVLVAIELGMEVGFPPMQALQSIAVINGRPSIWGDGFLALIMASPVYVDHDEWYEVDGERVSGLTAEDLKKPTTAAICSFSRKGKATPTVSRFSVAQATKAGLLGKQGPWTNYPDRMLRMRARSWAGRDAFPDVLRGLQTSEEAMDVDTFVAPTPVETVRPRRVSQTSVSEAKAEESAAPVQGVSNPVRIVAVRKPADDAAQEIEASDGNSYSTADSAMAQELQSFVGTDHHVRLTFTERGSARDLLDIALAEDVVAGDKR